MDQGQHKPNYGIVIKQVALIVIMFTVAVIVLNYTTDIFRGRNENLNSNQNNNTNINANIPIPSEYPDYVAIKGDKKDPNIVQFYLASSLKDEFGTIEGNSETYGGINYKVKVTGEFARAYLYFEGTIDDLPLSAFDDLYFTVDFRGGHIIDDQNSLPTPPGDTTKILLDLRSVSFYPKIVDKRAQTNKNVNIDLMSLLKNEKTISIISFISSERSPRFIGELSIYYECVENNQCNLELL